MVKEFITYTMDIEEFKKQKQQAILALISETAAQLVRQSNKTYPPKRIFRNKDRHPLKRIKKKQEQFKLFNTCYSTMIQLQIIISQPIPKFKTGTNAHPGELAGCGILEAYDAPCNINWQNPDIKSTPLPKSTSVFPDKIE